MAREIVDFDGTVLPVDSTNLYGGIKNAPSGTKINSKSNFDLQVFFQRMMALAGVTPNSLEENAANGFQLTTALNTLYVRRFNGMAAAFGASGFTPVTMSGCVNTGASGAYLISSGFFFYNGQFVNMAGSGAVLTGSNVPLINIFTIDGQPYANVTQGASVSPGASQFNYSAMVPWSTAVGIDGLVADLTIGTWTTPSVGTNWSAVAEGDFAAMKYNKDGLYGYVEGSVVSTGATPALTVFTMPSSSYFPNHGRAIIGQLFDGSGNFSAMLPMEVDTSGNVKIKASSLLPSGSGWALYVSARYILTT